MLLPLLSFGIMCAGKCRAPLHQQLLLLLLPFLFLCVSWFPRSSNAQRDCLSGQFGANCSFTCNCVSETACDNRDIGTGCSKGSDTSCNKGFFGTPQCQTNCTQLNGKWKYGVNCDSDCHCFANQTSCDSQEGNCKPDNLCEPGYYGSGCSYILPRLFNAPQVLYNNCSGIMVQWPAFVRNLTGNCSGESGEFIFAYRLEKQVLFNGVPDGWVYVEDIVKDSITTFQYFFGWETLISNNSVRYSFRVTCLVQSAAKDLYLNSPGPESNPISAAVCLIQSTPSPSVPSTAVLPTISVPLAQNLMLSSVDSRINVTWNSTGLSSSIYKVQITVQPLRVGDCQDIQPNDPKYPVELVEVLYSQGSWSSNLTKNWILYQVSVLTFASNNVSALVPSRSTIITAETFATGTPVIQLVGVGTNWFVFNLSLPACELRGGSFLWFNVVVNQMGGTKLINNNSQNMVHNITSGIMPFVTYLVLVKYINKLESVHPAPESRLNITTLETVPAPPTQLRIQSLNSSWVLIGWQAPNPPLALIVGYRVWVIDAPVGGNAGTVFNQTADVPYNILSFQVNGLNSASSYQVFVFSISNQALSVRSEAFNFITLSVEDQVTQLKIQIASANSLTVQWAAPSKDPSNVHHYFVDVASIRSLKPNAQTIHFNTSSYVTSTVIPSLQAATQYQVTVRAEYNGGIVGANTFILAWTPPGPIAANLMPAFTIISTDHSNARIQFAQVTSYTDGPISNYYVLVKKISSVHRRKRRALTSDYCSQTLNQTCDYIAAKLDPSNVVQLFVLGNNNVVGGQSNPPLDFSTVYQVFLAVTSEAGGYIVAQSIGANVTTSAVPTVAPTVATTVPPTVLRDNLNVGLLVGLLVALFLLILFIVIAILVYCYRSGKLFTALSKNKHSVDGGVVLNLDGMSSGVAHYEPNSGKHWNLINDVKEPRFVVLDPEFGPRNLDVNRLSPDSGISFEQEYYSLPVGLQHSVSASRQPENVMKNRTPLIVPYDHCRVTLQRRSSKSRQSDYINASFVDGYLRRRGYIVAQSPMDAQTAADFWLMVSQQNVAQIVMLCHSVEDTVLKSFVYWPTLGSKAQKFGDSVVETVAEEQRPHWLCRKLLIDGHLVTQFCFEGWPDHGVPNSPMPLIELYLAVKMTMRVEDGPLLVHCGTGVSRSAVFVAIDSLLQQAHHEGVVNVQRFCVKMRRARPSMIRTPRQYVFLYDALFEALMSGTLALVAEDVHKVYTQLASVNPRTGQSFFWEQQALLEKYTPRQGPCHDAVAPENAKKNRDNTTLPADVHRVRLHCAGSQVLSSDYINAVWLDGWSTQRQIILTQTPLPNTTEDVWRLIWDFEISVVVDLQIDAYDTPSFNTAIWWPRDKQETELRLGAFLIRRELVLDKTDNLQELRLLVSRDDAPNQSHRVRLWRPSLWNGLYDKTPMSKSATVSALRRVMQLDTRQRHTQQPSRPLLLMCADGAQRCGLAAACIISAASLHLHGYVDVFHVVRWMKLRRHQVLSHLDQYRYVFRFLQEWLRSDTSASTRLPAILNKDCLKMEESIYTHGQVPVVLNDTVAEHQILHTNYRYAAHELAKTLS